MLKKMICLKWILCGSRSTCTHAKPHARHFDCDADGLYCDMNYKSSPAMPVAEKCTEVEIEEE